MGWRYALAERDAVYRVIDERRDIRRFRPDPVPDEMLQRVLAAGHRAPNVGLCQPTRFIVVRSDSTRIAFRALAERERLRQADRLVGRSDHFLQQKIEGIVEAPIGLCVCCDLGEPGEEIFGRGTIPEAVPYSTVCAVQNIWLAARAEGLGVGWVSFYHRDDLRDLLGIPERVDPLAWLCIGFPDERPVRPGLEAAGWSKRLQLAETIHEESWAATDNRDAGHRAHRRWDGAALLPGAIAELARRVRPTDRLALIRTRDYRDRLVTARAAFGNLDAVVERWAGITGDAPGERLRAGVLALAASHGYAVHGTSGRNPQAARVAVAAAAAGDTALGILARARGHIVKVADVGLDTETPSGAISCKAGAGAADPLRGSTLGADSACSAAVAGAQLACQLIAQNVDCIVIGDVGASDTTAAAAVLCALSGISPRRAVGGGSGADAQTIDRRRQVIERALEVNGAGGGAFDAIAALGSADLAAGVGAILQSAAAARPVLLDGPVIAVAAMVAVRIAPSVREYLIAAHKGPDPLHALALSELGLEPLLDLRLEVGECAGGMLVIDLIERSGLLHRSLGKFDEAAA